MRSRHALQSHPLLVSLFTALSLTLGADQVRAQHSTPSAGEQAEFAPRGQRNLVRPIKYGDWQKYCFKTPGTNQVCRTTITGTFDTGQTAVRVDLIEREGKGESKARLQLFVPVGMYLQAGVKLTVDQNRPHQIPYVWCLTNTCIAANVADATLIHELEKGQSLQLDVVDSSLQRVSTTLPLGRFGLVRQAAPARTFEQDIDE